MTQLQSPAQTPAQTRKRVRSVTPPGTPVGAEDDNTAVDEVSEDSNSDDSEEEEEEEEEEHIANELSEVAPPLWEKNARFLLAYLLRRGDAQATTHSSLVGGRYHVPLERRKTFLAEYFDEFIRTTLTSTPSTPSLYLTERYNGEFFRFFIDVDYSWDATPPDVLATIRHVKKAVAGIVSYVSEGALYDIEVRPSERTTFKRHFVFPQVILSHARCLLFAQSVEKLLRLQCDLDVEFDMKVYQRGSLRMLGSCKRSGLESSHARETEFFYMPINPTTGERCTEITLEEFERHTILLDKETHDRVEQFMESGDGVVHLPGDQYGEELFVTCKYIHSGESHQPSNSSRIAVSKYTGPDVVVLASPLYTFLEERFGVQVASNANRITHDPKSNAVFISLDKNSTYCPLAGKTHTSNHGYLIISSKGLRALCYSTNDPRCTAGGALIPYKDLPVEVAEMVPEEVFYTNPAQNAAFIRSFSGTDRDVAEYASFALRGIFVAVNTKNNDSTWWFFSKGRWNNAAAGTRLYRALDRLPLVYEEIAEKSDDDKEEKKFRNIAMKCSDLTFLNKLLSRMCRILHDTTFENKLDSKRHLLGFDNGVYDFEKMTFRPSVKEDYLTMSVGYDFPKESDPIYREKLDKFYTDIQPDPVQRLYLKKVLAGSLNTSNPKEEFYVLSGNTRNGKTGLGDLHSCTLGSKEFADENDNKHKYASSYNATFLTKERKGPEVPAPDLVDFRLCRFLIGNEPPPDSKINTSTLKKTVGRDTFSGRLLHENKMWHFKIFALIFMNCNDRPAMTSNEPAVWGKVRVINFPNKFVPNPTLPHELLEDPKLKTEMVTDVGWRREHMKMLIEIYETELIPNGLVPPESVIASTAEYREATHVSTVDLRESFMFSEYGDRTISAKAFTKRLRSELGVNINSSVRCVGKDNPTTGVENRRLKGSEENIAPVI